MAAITGLQRWRHDRPLRSWEQLDRNLADLERLLKLSDSTLEGLAGDAAPGATPLSFHPGAALNNGSTLSGGVGSGLPRFNLSDSATQGAIGAFTVPSSWVGVPLTIDAIINPPNAGNYRLRWILDDGWGAGAQNEATHTLTTGQQVYTLSSSATLTGATLGGDRKSVV